MSARRRLKPALLPPLTEMPKVAFKSTDENISDFE
jgi:hypothetical protein